MKRGIVQLCLTVFMLVLVSYAQGENNKTVTKTTIPTDEVKEETGHYSIQVRPESNYGSRSRSQSTSSSKSVGTGQGKGVGYGSNEPQNKGPSHGSEEYSGHHESDYEGRGGSQEQHGSHHGQGYKSNVESPKYVRHNTQSSAPEYPKQYEERYDDRLASSKPGRGNHGKDYGSASYGAGGQSESNIGYSGKVVPDVPSYGGSQYSGLNNHQSAGFGGQSYGDSRPGMIDHGYQGSEVDFQGSSHQGSGSHSYGGSDDRISNGQYGRTLSNAQYSPTHLEQKNIGAPVFHPEGKEGLGGSLSNEKLAVFIRQLGNLPLVHSQAGKSPVSSSSDKYGAATGRGKEQQGFLLLPLVNNQGSGGAKNYGGNSGVNEVQGGYGGGKANTGYGSQSAAKTSYGEAENIGYAFNGYKAPVVQQKYEPKQNFQGYGDGGNNYNVAGSTDYSEGKDQGYGRLTGGKESLYGSPYGGGGDSYEGKYQPVGISTGYSGEGSSKGFQIGGGGGVSPSAGYTHGSSYGVDEPYGKSNYGSSGAHEGNPQGSYGYNQGTSGLHYDNKAGVGGGGYATPNRGLAKSNGGGEYSGAANVGGDYSGAAGGYDHGKASYDAGKGYGGVVDFGSNGGSGYKESKSYPKSAEGGEERQNVNLGNFGKLEDIMSYKQQNDKSYQGNYPSTGIISGGYNQGRDYSGGYEKYPNQGIEQNIRNLATFQANVPKPAKSLAIVLQKQPVSPPRGSPVSPFGHSLTGQLKSPFNDFLNQGQGLNFDLGGGGYGGGGFQHFDPSFAGRANTGGLVHTFSGDFSPLNFAASQGVLY